MCRLVWTGTSLLCLEAGFVIIPGVYIYISPIGNFAVCFLGASRVRIQGPVVQSIVSLASSLRSQLIKCFMTL